VSTPRSVDGLRRSTQQRSTVTRRKITKALRDMRKKGLAINAHAVANYAGVARKSVYNHRDLLDQIRAESAKPPLSTAGAASSVTDESSIVAALREQLRTQRQRYETTVAKLKGEVNTLEQALAAAHGELHRLRKTGTSDTSQRG
jgi:hypothetical protein